MRLYRLRVRSGEDSAFCIDCCFQFYFEKYVLHLRPAAELQGGNPKKGIVAIYITDTEPEFFVTAKKLGCIKKVIVTVGRNIIIGKSHKRNFSLIHQVRKMGMGDR